MAETDNTQAASIAVASATVTKTEAPGFILVVRIAFADHQIGEEITDPAIIREILGGDQAVYVIKRAA